MNNIDTIIKYLSGDLELLSRAEFEKALETIPDLAEEYRSILKIWQLTKKQLAIDDLPDSSEREELIATVLAAHDVEFYRNKAISKKEQELKDELDRIMSTETIKPTVVNKKPGRVIYRLSVMVAALAAILLITLLPGPDLNQLASTYYDPMDDPDLDFYALTSRSVTANGIFLFKEGEFQTARNFFESNLEEMIPMEELFYALSCYETGDQQKAISLLDGLTLSNEYAVSYKTKWYLSLIHIKTGDKQKAIKLLSEVQEDEGIYQRKSKKLLRKMK